MERPVIEQATELLTGSTEILLACPEKPSYDAFCSMVALALALEKRGSSITMICASHVPQKLQFLPGTSQVQENIEKTSELIVEIPLGSTRPANISWEKDRETLRFFITPEKGKGFANPSVTTFAGSYPWNLIVTLGSSDLHSLGRPFTENAAFFYETPIINIDRGTGNELYGSVNLVPATAGTVAEVTYDLIQAAGGVNIISPEAATSLFAGLLSGTNSFQTPATSPRTFTVASELLQQEADRQTVTKNLYKTHPLSELKLAGRSLARLSELAPGILYSTLLAYDFEESESTPDDVVRILYEMVDRAGDTSVILQVFERSPETLEVLIYPGKISLEEQEKLRESLNGTSLNNFVLVSLGNINPENIEQSLKEVVLKALPQFATKNTSRA